MSEVLPDRMEQNARVEIMCDGVSKGIRRAIDFVGATAVDSPTGERVTVTTSGGATEDDAFAIGFLLGQMPR